MVAASFPLDLKEHHLAWPTFSAGQAETEWNEGGLPSQAFLTLFWNFVGKCQ